MTILKTAARETIDTWNNFNSITRTLVVWVVSESQEVNGVWENDTWYPFTPLTGVQFCSRRGSTD